jgi:DNA polymerase III delta prime subunit
MLSRLIISEDRQDQINKSEAFLQDLGVKNPHPDLLWIENDQSKSLGVKDAKTIREHLSFKPYSAKGRVVVVIGADMLSIDAQNSLLKTLEEPVESAAIILTAQSEEGLLETIRSRTQIIRVRTNSYPNTVSSETVQELIDSPLYKRFEIIEKVADKDRLLSEIVVYITRELARNPSLLSFAKILLEAEKWNKAQGNTRVILEYLMLNL